MPKYCENRHCIDKDGYIILGKVVGVCPCGNKYMQERIVSIYVGDLYNELEEVFHKYRFLVPFQCHGCGRFLDSITLVCDKKTDPFKNWDDAKQENVMPSGLFKN